MDEFLQMLEKHRHEFYGYIYRTVWDTENADDVFSAAVLTAYRNRRQYVPGTNFRAWMYRIITNKCFSANRETARSPQRLDDLADSLTALQTEPGYVDVLNSPDEFLDRCGDEVRIAFRKLSTAERSCLLLKAVEQFSYKEIATILEIPVGTVMTHLARGRTKLRKELLEYGRREGWLRKPFHYLSSEKEEEAADVHIG
jgi:RNA polymerase sigma-70 factor (ECF subfamily)